MSVRLIATALMAVLLASPALGQGWDVEERGFGRDRREPRMESREGADRDRPTRLDRRQRIERAEERIRQRNTHRRPGEAGGRWGDGVPDGIYRRSGNYRRW